MTDIDIVTTDGEGPHWVRTDIFINGKKCNDILSYHTNISTDTVDTTTITFLNPNTTNNSDIKNIEVGKASTWKEKFAGGHD